MHTLQSVYFKALSNKFVTPNISTHYCDDVYKLKHEWRSGNGVYNANNRLFCLAS